MAFGRVALLLKAASLFLTSPLDNFRFAIIFLVVRGTLPEVSLSGAERELVRGRAKSAKPD